MKFCYGVLLAAFLLAAVVCAEHMEYSYDPES
uniref:Chemokine (C-C motif) ligand 14 n=1 Tax=Steinernema glaseri TaxID=37863 RepID=A0A1I7ZXG5_9BILA